jgi:erythromycin esterase
LLKFDENLMMNRQSGRLFLFCIICCLYLSGGCRRGNEGEDVDLTWLRKEIVDITNLDPYVNDTAFDAILEKIGDAQIVGLGEATHGTTEFWSVRQKITRYLVEKKGFNIVLMEASLPGSFALHDYITAGTGIAFEAHQKLGSWKYLEMQGLINWMRQYNIDHPSNINGPALHFYGYDCAFANWTEAIKLITTYLQAVDPGEVDNISTRLLQHTKEEAEFVTAFFISRKSQYTSLSSEKDYKIILRIVMNLVPSWEIWNRLSQDKPTLEYRDSVNIINIKWILETLTSGGKIVLWAHNGHVRKGYMEDSGGKARMLGSRLNEQYGASYYSIATEFYCGQFLAWDECEDHDFQFISLNAHLPPTDSYTYWFEQTGVPLFFLDLSQIDYRDRDAAWLAGPKKIRMIGATYCYNLDNQYYDFISLPEYYDGLIFIESSRPTTTITFPGKPAGK